ncbi:MAG TPA: PLP-dependent aminotransferase family protein [Streptosporangiaceae bacterium]
MAGKQTNLAWETLLAVPGQPGTRGKRRLPDRLASAIRAAIRDGRLPHGAALPPSRTLAADLGVSRWAVTEAYSRLITEGYLAGRTGSATRVCWTPRPHEDPPPPTPPAEPPPRPVRYDLGYRSDQRAFPRRQWVEAIRAAAETASFDQLDYAQDGGHPRLREVLAAHLNRSRGAAAEPGTLSVFAGAGQAMAQVSHALRDDGHTAIGMEDPGSPRLWQAARAAGLDLVPLPVDDGGLVVDALRDHPGLRAVCAGTARQVAYGYPLAASRRAALLDWARQAGGLIIEDDYDSEFSYAGPVPPVLQGAGRDHVALLGSMTRTLNPTVSIGWVVAPGRLVSAVRAGRGLPVSPPALNQLALAHFMESGAYDRHLRASRQRFRARRAALAGALARELPGYRVRAGQAGLDLLLDLPPGTDTAAILAAAGRRDMRLGTLDALRLVPDPGAPGLLLGYGNLSDRLVDEAVTVLAEVLRQTVP